MIPTQSEGVGAVLTSSSGVHARPIAEHVLALMLYFERELDRCRKQQLQSEWQRFPAGELGTQTLGIVGVGAIGGRVAELGSSFGMEILGLWKHPSRDHPAVDEMFGADERHELLGRSDYVVIACPLTDETYEMIGEAEISSMNDEAILVNVTRGSIIDQDALLTKLQTGYIGGAVLDVAQREPLPQDSPLWNMSNVIITPHMAGGSPHFPERCAEIFVENYYCLTAGRPEEMRNRAV